MFLTSCYAQDCREIIEMPHISKYSGVFTFYLSFLRLHGGVDRNFKSLSFSCISIFCALAVIGEIFLFNDLF